MTAVPPRPAVHDRYWLCTDDCTTDCGACKGAGRPTAPDATAGDGSALARRFHETYERLAPQFGYETRRESAVPWEQVPEANRALMIAVCRDVLAAAARDAEMVRVVREAIDLLSPGSQQLIRHILGGGTS